VWILHGLFYFCLLELVPLACVIAVDVVRGPFADLGGLVAGLAVFALPAVVLWGLAKDLDRGSEGERNLLQRVLLLYAPREPVRWAGHALFYLSLLALLAVLMIVPDMIRQREITGLESLGFWLFFLIVLRKTVPKTDPATRRVNRIDSWLLLYAPRKGWAWVAHVMYWLLLMTGTASLLASLPLPGQFPTRLSIDSVAMLIFVLLLMWSLASDVETGQRRPPGFLRRAFLFYIPARTWLWALHIVFYLAVLEVIGSANEVLTGQLRVVRIDTNTGAMKEVFPFLLLATVFYFALMAFVSRTLAAGWEPWAQGLPRWIRWFSAAEAPRGLSKRFSFYGCTIVFYATVVAWPYVLFETLNAMRDRNMFELEVTLPTVGVGLACRWIMGLLRAKTTASPSWGPAEQPAMPEPEFEQARKQG